MAVNVDGVDILSDCARVRTFRRQEKLAWFVAAKVNCVEGFKASSFGDTSGPASWSLDAV